MPPPSTQHCARLGPVSNSSSRLGVDGHRATNAFMGGSQAQTPSHRQPFATLNSNNVNRSGVSGYGMSAGVKVGRQQGIGRISIIEDDLIILLTSAQLLALQVFTIPVKATTEIVF